MSDYILKKEYNSCYGDIVPIILSKVLNLTIKCYDQLNGYINVLQVGLTPESTPAIAIYRNQEHYNGLDTYQLPYVASSGLKKFQPEKTF